MTAGAAAPVPASQPPLPLSPGCRGGAHAAVGLHRPLLSVVLHSGSGIACAHGEIVAVIAVSSELYLLPLSVEQFRWRARWPWFAGVHRYCKTMGNHRFAG